MSKRCHPRRLVGMAAALFLSAAGSAAGAAQETAAPVPQAVSIISASFQSFPTLAQYQGRPVPPGGAMSPEERARMQRQYREWQALPPDQRDAMRRRMDELNRMPPQERNRYQQRYQQWQQLPPEERRKLENNLRRWDNLSPQERDSIRQRFKN